MFLNGFAEQLNHVHSLHPTGLEALCPGYEDTLKQTERCGYVDLHDLHTDSQYNQSRVHTV